MMWSSDSGAALARRRHLRTAARRDFEFALSPAVRLLLLCATVALCAGCGSKQEAASVDDARPPAVGAEVIFPYSADLAGYSGTTYFEGKIESIDGTRAVVRETELRGGSAYPGTSTREVELARLYKVPKADSEREVKVGDIVVAKNEAKSTKLAVWYAAEVIRINEYGIQVKNFRQPDDLWFVDADELVRPNAESIAGFRKDDELSAFSREAKKRRPVKVEGYKPQKGDKVIAEGLTEFWHSATVIDVTGAMISVAWEDSNTKLDGTIYTVVPLPADATSPALNVGRYLLIKPVSGGHWLYAQVTKVEGQSAEVKVEDGTTRTVNPGEFWPLE
jgi:hypothetical protein